MRAGLTLAPFRQTLEQDMASETSRAKAAEKARSDVEAVREVGREQDALVPSPQRVAADDRRRGSPR